MQGLTKVKGTRFSRRALALLLVLGIIMSGLPGARPRVARASTAPIARLKWSMTRFTGIFLHDPNDLDTARAYVNPPEGYSIFLDGCDSESFDPALYIATYTYEISGPTLSQPQRVTRTYRPLDGVRLNRRIDPDRDPDADPSPDSDCHALTASFTVPLGHDYTLKLMVTDNEGLSDEVILEKVAVRDFLIVSLGDSYASGEGAPDEAQGLIIDLPGFGIADPQRPVHWSDRRCHRSLRAAAAQAARQIELNDPHTSVTFLSLACSGATIDRPTLKDNDVNKPQGSGLLGGYSGVEWNGPWDEASRLPAQVDQMRSIVTDDNGVQKRPIDALLISGGGNDSYFADIVVACVFNNIPGLECHNQTQVNTWVNSELINTDADGLTSLEQRYKRLHDAIHAEGFQVSNVFVTEYPDPTRDQDGNWCGTWPTLDPFLFNISNRESPWASEVVITRLNENIHRVGARYASDRWHSVDGISEAFFGDPAHGEPGHGFCSSDRWMNTTLDAIVTQGPLTFPFPAAVVVADVIPFLGLLAVLLSAQDFLNTKGTMHPNYAGQTAIKNILVEALTPQLYYDPSNPAPAFSASQMASAGVNGWLVSSVAATVTAEDADGIVEPRMSINEQPGCAVAGVTCTRQAINAQTFQWVVTIPVEGVYHLQFAAQDGNFKLGSFPYDLKVDLNDPTAMASVDSVDPPVNGWYSGPVDLMLIGADTPSGSGVALLEYSVNGGPTQQSASGSPLQLTDQGVHNVTFQAVDYAGRRSASQMEVIKIDRAAPVSTATLMPVANVAGWMKNDVTVALSATDTPGAGVGTITYSATGAQSIGSTTVNGATASLNIMTEGETMVTYFARDQVGHIETPKTVTVKLDKHDPQLQCSQAPPPLSSGWNNTDVTVSFTATDSLSGIATVSSPVRVSTEGANQPITGTASDKAGNSASATCRVSIDKRPPVVTVSASPTTLWPPNGKMVPVTISGTIIDQPSGVSTATYAVTDEYGNIQPSGSVLLGANGSYAFTIQLQASRDGNDKDGRQYTITVSARDTAGNQTSVSTGVTVPHDQGQ